MLTFLKWAWQRGVTLYKGKINLAISMTPFILQGNVTPYGDLYFDRCTKSMYTNFLHNEFLGHPLLLPKTLTKVPNMNIGSDHQNILHEYFYYIAI